MTQLLIATRNAHKVQEIRAILSNAFDYLSLVDFPDAPQVIEDAPDFAGNAIKKAMALAEWLRRKGPAPSWPPGLRLLVLADDSGLEVDALDGAPGVHSARFAALDKPEAADTSAPKVGAGNASDAANNAKLLRLLAPVPREQRTARFRCVLAVVPANPPAPELNAELFEGSCEGHIDFTPTGHGGFGYDPLFVPQGHAQSFAELGEAVKNQLSHRAQALMKLRSWLKD